MQRPAISACRDFGLRGFGLRHRQLRHDVDVAAKLAIQGGDPGELRARHLRR